MMHSSRSLVYVFLLTDFLLSSWMNEPLKLLSCWLLMGALACLGCSVYVRAW
jgi:positive regulator of sigma E activity